MRLARELPSGLRPAAQVLSLLAGLAAVPTIPLPAQVPEGSGRIEGLATLAQRLTRQHRRVRIYAEPDARETPAAAEENPLQNVVIYLEEVAGDAPAAQPPVMRQHGERFVPHVLPIVAGTSVAFPNDDPIYHNVFSLSQARSFDLGRYPRGESRSLTFPRPGVVQVFCHIHADMSAYILVLRNGYFAKPDSTGHFTIAGVPPGSYRMVTWHERIRPVAQPVNVEAGGTTQVSVAVPLAEAVNAR